MEPLKFAVTWPIPTRLFSIWPPSEHSQLRNIRKFRNLRHFCRLCDVNFDCSSESNSRIRALKYNKTESRIL